MARKEPNIVITGTPGVGKTSHCQALAASTSLKHLSVNEIAKTRGCLDGVDSELGSALVDEDKLLDTLEDVEDVKNVGGFMIDWHACDLFPESWIDLVVVLRSKSEVHYDRLEPRKYSKQKLDENIDAEIMGVLLYEAQGAFEEDIVIELESNSMKDLISNVQRIEQWIENWKKNQEDGE